MERESEYPRQIWSAVALAVGTLAALAATVHPVTGVGPVDVGDLPLIGLIALHGAWAMALLFSAPATGTVERRFAAEARRRNAELLFFVVALLYLFAYVFALNANMDYVQRFAATSGNLQIAIDTRTERLHASARFVPLLLVDLGVWLAGGAALRRTGGSTAPVPGRSWRRVGPSWITAGAPVLVVAAIVLSVLAQPSSLRLEGIPLLGWVALVPLFVVTRTLVDARQYGRAVAYGVLFGAGFTLVGNYWLGTFNLISLQAVGVIFTVFYLLFFAVLVTLLALAGGSRWAFLITPFAWTGFELARSSGFLGYPWLLVAHSQYRFTALIQIAELGGVWLVSLIVLIVNALVAEALLRFLGGALRGTDGGSRRLLVAAAAVAAIATAAGALLGLRPIEARDTVRLALIQQNSDPRKHDYNATLDALIRLTDEAVAYDPDLVVWSETAFVPNIRRWSQEDPRRPLARLVNQFLAYQDGLDRWLLTGNDDYRRVFDADGNEVGRDSFNAAVLFSDDSRRVDTYHKIKLVPFTEHFPFGDVFPGVYALLQEFDISFWTPGDERTVFRHPRFTFATPICFEDVFPQEVRAFARAGAEVIVNITNDYWSLNPLAAQQHFVAAMFRTVELRRPMVRATASGVTSHVDAFGRIVDQSPQYVEAYLIADVDVPAEPRTTLFMYLGDWVPLSSIAVAIALAIAGVVERRKPETR